VVAGVPVIFGGVLVGGVVTAVTVIAKALSDTLEWPSLTLMTIFGKEPTFALAGVPLNNPVLVLNDAHDGWPVMENTSA
jgi:ABC-type uncharacterized transport system permease subunit